MSTFTCWRKWGPTSQSWGIVWAWDTLRRSLVWSAAGLATNSFFLLAVFSVQGSFFGFSVWKNSLISMEDPTLGKTFSLSFMPATTMCRSWTVEELSDLTWPPSMPLNLSLNVASQAWEDTVRFVAEGSPSFVKVNWYKFWYCVLGKHTFLH